MSKKVAIRDAYGQALKELGAKSSNVVVLEADVGGSTKSILFGKEFPERYFNVGISEMNMVDMSAGLALTGYIPFVNTFAVFLASRALDPVQSLIAYDHLNVRLCGTYCGLSDSYDGASHHAITDIAAMRAIAGMTIISVSDPVMTKKAVYELAKFEGPVYLRLSRAEALVIYEEHEEFTIGKGNVLKNGDDITIISTGTILSKVMKAAEILEEEGIHATVVDMHTIKPLDEVLVEECAKRTGAILTVEEHSIYGGLGSAVAEAVGKRCPVPVSIFGMTDFAESGDLDQLMEKYGYSAVHIAELAKEAVAKKKN